MCRHVLSFMCLFLISISVFATYSTPQASKSENQSVKVVATFSVLADMVQQIGQPYVQTSSLVAWDEDAHVYQPAPDDVKQIAQADLLVLNGLGFEGWLARLLSASGYQGEQVVATQGVNLISLNPLEAKHDHHGHHGHGDEKHQNTHLYDPHAWNSLAAAGMYAENIARGLSKVDPRHANEYKQNLVRFQEKLHELNKEIMANIAKIPLAERRIVVPHNAFAYLARDYQLNVHSLQGLSTESEASAADIVKTVRLIRAMKVKALFTETVADQRLLKVIEKETNVKIGGSLISGALSKQLAPTYLEMMRYNTQLIVNALTK